MLAIKNMTTNTWVRQLSILQGWTISTTIDGTYYYAVVKYISTTSKGYAPLTPAFLSQVFYITTSIEALPAIDKSYKFFLVMSDTSQTQKRLGGNEYIHTLTLIEPTKYLERIICSADAFTYRAIGTLYAQATKALINAEVLVARTAPRFSFGAETVTALSSRPSEEYYFSKPNTLKEQLDVFFKEINSRPYVPKLTNFADIVISHYDLSKILNEVSIASNIVNKSEDLKIENFTDRVVSFGENALDSRANTVIQGFETFKPNKLETLDTNNAIIQLQMPIEELIKFELNTEVTLKKRDTNVFWKDIRASIDLTEYFYEEEIYRLLTVDQQKKAFFYTRGSNTIGDINRTYKSFLGIVTSAVLGAVLDDYLLYYDYVNNPSDIPKHPDYAFSLLKISRKLMGKALITDSPFKIEYVPYIDFHMDVSKNIKQEYTTALFDNQSESIVDVYAYGNNLQQKVNKIGNAEKFLDTIITNLTELKNLGDFTAEKEVITSITSSVYDRFVKVRYSLTKDYANLYQDIALDRKKTLYNIPLESVTSDILVKNIVNVSTEALTPTTFVGLNTNGLRQLIATLTNNYRLEDLRVKGILTEVKNAGINPDYDSYYYYLNTANYAGGNSLYFRMSFLDNYNAGVSIESMGAGQNPVIGGKQVIVNPYCSSNGVFDNLKIMLATDIFDVDNLAEFKALPKVAKTNVSTNEKLSEEITLARYKDPAVKIAITYQVELMPTADIMIGRHFIEKNLLAFKDTVGANMKIYFGATPQDINDPFKVSSYLFAIDTATTTISNGVLTIGNTPPGGYIAIGDNNRNLYLAINKEGYKKVYFTASHKVL